MRLTTRALLSTSFRRVRSAPGRWPHEGRLELAGALNSTVGISALVYGIVRSADAGYTDPVTVIALTVGLLLVGLFVADQKRSPQPIMPLRLFRSRERAGAYAARFLFNGAPISFFFFMTQYLQAVRGDTPLEAGLAFLPVIAAAFAAAAATPRLLQRASNPLLSVLGSAAIIIGTASISRARSTPATSPESSRRWSSSGSPKLWA